MARDLLQRAELEMLSEEMTEKVFRYICEYSRRHGLPPSYKKIAAHLGVTVSTVRRYLDVLEARGMIYREDNGKPAIRIISNGNERHHESS